MCIQPKKDLCKFNRCGFRPPVNPALCLDLQWQLLPFPGQTEEQSKRGIWKNTTGGSRSNGASLNPEYKFYCPVAQNDRNTSAVALMGLLIDTSDSTIILPSAEASTFKPCK